ncbi:outer membrane protein assembly factor BamA [Palleronia sp. KMU-117]|uniref:outer membrane protein assembly factor BamA n=1 Tax=Palleronia sp. KMU-117 TaxID=3434108 RepID=UPI003D7347F7
MAGLGSVLGSISAGVTLGLRIGVAPVLLSAGAVSFVPAAAFAQTFEFDRFVVEGNQRIEPASVLSFAGLAPGQTLSAGQVNDALQRVIASGFFETVEFEPRGDTLVIRVVERPTISAISIEGNARIDDEDLLPLLTSAGSRVFTADAAEADAQAIISAYEARGRFVASVTPKIIRRPDNRVDLVFEVVEGNVVEIERISFVGNTQFSDRRLRRVLASKQAGLLRSLVSSDTFVADRIAFDRRLLTDFYQSRGFIDFVVLDVASEFSRERNATFLTFTVREGQKFEFNNIRVSTLLPEVVLPEFERVVNIRAGQTYSPVAIQNLIDRLENVATNNQLDFVRVDPVITRDDRNQTVNVDFQLVRGPRIFVERIDIEGNATTLDQVIRQQFRVVEGDPFNPREIQRATERIRALGFFETAEVDTRQGSAPDQVLVDVNVVEQPTGSLSFGASYSVDDGIGFIIGFSERNFLGRGQTLSFDIAAGAQNANSQITFIEPFFLGRDLSFRFNAYYTESSFDNVSYNTRRVGLTPSLTFPLNEAARLTVGYEISKDSILDVDEGASPILQEEEGSTYTSSVSYLLSYDSRRTGLFPFGGYRLTFGQEFAGLGGDNTFIRTTARAYAERDVLGEEVTLSTYLEGGALNWFDGDSTVINRFNSSSNALRGFASRGIGPRDTNAEIDDVLGGNYYMVFGVEAEFPLGLPEEYGITAGVFFNAGSVWGLDNTDGAGGPDSVDDSFELRSAAGVSIFWTTPLGPLRLDFSQPIDSNPLDETQNFNLSVSTRF